jgi:hypothetical protein
MSLSLLTLPSSISRPSDKRNALAASAHGPGLRTQIPASGQPGELRERGRRSSGPELYPPTCLIRSSKARKNRLSGGSPPPQRSPHLPSLVPQDSGRFDHDTRANHLAGQRRASCYKLLQLFSFGLSQGNEIHLRACANRRATFRT